MNGQSDITWLKDGVLGFGDIRVCESAKREEWALVHACKDPCHRKYVGYAGHLSKGHPEYLAAEKDENLYMNIIDPPLPLFQKESFSLFFDFIDRHLHRKPVVIHCNKGESRAPSLALLVMAKRLKMIPDAGYVTARFAFQEKCDYKPGAGISRFLEENWEALGR